MRCFSLLALAALAGATASAATYVWNPTTVDSKNHYLWETPANWLVNDSTATSYPNSADAIVEVPGNKSQLYNGTGKCKEFHYTDASSFPIVNQGTLKLVTGGKFSFDAFSSKNGTTINWYASITCGDTGETGEVEVNIPAHMNLNLQKGVTGPCTFVKTGAGTLTDAYEVTNPSKNTERSFSVPKVLLREGVLNLWSNKICNGLEIVFDGASDDLKVCYGATQTFVRDLTIKSGAIRESALAEGTAHGFTTYSTNVRQIVMTGAPKVNPMRFTGRFYQNAGLCWAPDAAETPYEFQFAKSVSDTTGQLVVSNGVVRLTEGASFTALSRVAVAGGTLKVDALSGLGFHAEAMEIAASGATLDLGRGVVLACDAATYGASALSDGVYTAANAAWITGEGSVEVGEVARPSEILTVTEGSSYAFTANCAYAGAVLTTEADFTFTTSSGAGVTLGAQGLVATGATAARTVTIDCPVCIDGTQTWTFAANDTVVVRGNVITSRDGGVWRIAGAKAVEFRGTNAFVHTLAVSNAVVRFYGTPSLGGDCGTVTCDACSGGRLHFYGVTTGKGVRFDGEKPGTVVIAQFHASADGLVTTNLFTGYCETQFSGNQYFSIDKDVTAHFRGGVYKKGGLFGPSGEGSMVISDNILTPARLSQNNSTTLILDVAGNVLGGNAGQSASTARLETRVPYAICAYKGDSVMARLTLSGTLDLCGCDQSVAAINGSGTVTSDAPAFLHVDDRAIAGSADGGSTSQVTRVTFQGAAGFSKDGTLTNWLYVASSSTGTVQVTEGCLVFPAKGSEPLALKSGTYPRPKADIGWPSASKAIVAGGEMLLEHSQAWGAETAVEIGAGKLNLASGVRQRCASLVLDGVEAEAGIYGSSESAADIRDDVHFAGTGVLRVGKLGVVILLK